MPEKYLSVNEVLAELKMEKEELESMVSDGKLRAFRDGENIKFKKEDIDQFKTSQGSAPTIILPSDLGEEEMLGTELAPLDADKTREALPAISMGRMGTGPIVAPPGEETSLPTVDLGDEEPGGVTEHIVFEEEQIPEVPPVYGEDIIIDEKDLLPEDEGSATVIEEPGVEDDLVTSATDTERIDDQITVFEETEEVGVAADQLAIEKIGAGVGPPAGGAPAGRRGSRRVPGAAAAAARSVPVAPPARERLRAIQQQRVGNPVFALFLVSCIPVAILGGAIVVNDVIDRNPWYAQRLQAEVRQMLDGRREHVKGWNRGYVWPEETLDVANVENWKELWMNRRRANIPLSEEIEVRPSEWKVDLILTPEDEKYLLDRNQPSAVPPPGAPGGPTTSGSSTPPSSSPPPGPPGPPPAR